MTQFCFSFSALPNPALHSTRTAAKWADFPITLLVQIFSYSSIQLKRLLGLMNGRVSSALPRAGPDPLGIFPEPRTCGGTCQNTAALFTALLVLSSGLDRELISGEPTTPRETFPPAGWRRPGIRPFLATMNTYGCIWPLLCRQF